MIVKIETIEPKVLTLISGIPEANTNHERPIQGLLTACRWSAAAQCAWPTRRARPWPVTLDSVSPPCQPIYDRLYFPVKRQFQLLRILKTSKCSEKRMTAVIVRVIRPRAP
jgi:hypothetical protein